METVLAPSKNESFGKAAYTKVDQNRLSVSAIPSTPKAVQDLPAPSPGFFTIYDTLIAQVYDTLRATIYDTVTVIRYDTVVVYDSVLVDKTVTGARTVQSLAVFSIHPNPASSYVLANFALLATREMQIELHDAKGAFIKTLLGQQMGAGNHTVSLELGQQPAGYYLLRFRHGQTEITKNLVIMEN
ncbi:MAG: T9SS type A sorting domain-containing protein [Cytophagales bacterium]|nr:T9SS type A sorting domain-containing protein [Cytophagales bacterium]